MGLGLSIKHLIAPESEVGKGSKFFNITSKPASMSMDAMLTKMAPFGNWNILFIDTAYDQTGVADQIQEPGLRPYVIYDPLEVADTGIFPNVDNAPPTSYRLYTSERTWICHMKWWPTNTSLGLSWIHHVPFWQR